MKSKMKIIIYKPVLILSDQPVILPAGNKRLGLL